MNDDTQREISQIDPTLRVVIRELVSGVKPWPLFLTGQPGRGKTAAILCLCDYVKDSAYFRFPRLLKSFLWSTQPKGVVIERQRWQEHLPVKLTLTKESLNEHEFFEFLRRVPLLVIDDVATRSEYTDPQFDNFYEVLEDRKRKPTIVASNLGLDDIGSVFDDRIKSRLARGTIFTLGGRDRRLPK